jgi:hypothetical protein
VGGDSFVSVNTWRPLAIEGAAGTVWLHNLSFIMAHQDARSHRTYLCERLLPLLLESSCSIGVSGLNIQPGAR